MFTHRSSIRQTLRASLVVTCLVTAVAGGAPQSATGDDARLFQEIHRLEAASQRRPGDMNLRRQLDDARALAAESLAADAREAMRQELFARAVQLAGRAADFDPRFLNLRDQAEDAWFDALLRRGRTAMEAGNFDRAQQAANELERLQPNAQVTRLFLAELQARNGESAASEALMLARTGDFEAAFAAARHAMDLLPGDPEIAELPLVLQTMERRTRFNAMLSEADLALHNGNLNVAEALLRQLSALDVDVARLDAFADQVNARRAGFIEWRDLGRAHMNAGRLDDAADAYRRAASVMRDDAAFRREFEQAMNQVELQTHMDAASAFLDQGALDAALVEAEAAVATLESPQSRALLARIQSAHAALAFDAALDRGDAGSALSILDADLLRTGDASRMARRDDLAQRFVEDVKRDATLAHLDGNTARALSMIRDALTVHPAAILHDLYVRFEGEDLLRRAVDADRRGDWQLAERLYLDAMQVVSNREMVGMRLNESRRLASLEEQNRQLSYERDQLASDLDGLSDLERRNSRVARDLQSQLNQAVREIDQLRRREADLVRAVREDDRHHDQLHRQLDDLKCENERLCRELNEWKRQAERWRNRYEQERRRHGRHHGE